MAARQILARAEPGFTLPAFERLATPPPPDLAAARLEANSAPGDIVADLHGRGGWVARAAVDRQLQAGLAPWRRREGGERRVDVPQVRWPEDDFGEEPGERARLQAEGAPCTLLLFLPIANCLLPILTKVQ